MVLHWCDFIKLHQPLFNIIPKVVILSLLLAVHRTYHSNTIQYLFGITIVSSFVGCPLVNQKHAKARTALGLINKTNILCSTISEIFVKNCDVLTLSTLVNSGAVSTLKNMKNCESRPLDSLLISKDDMEWLMLRQNRVLCWVIGIQEERQELNFVKNLPKVKGFFFQQIVWIGNWLRNNTYARMTET